VLFISHITAEFQKIIGSTPLPKDLSIVDMDKKPLFKAELAGKIVVIDFWGNLVQALHSLFSLSASGVQKICG
jgi:hypothetical protein